MASQISFITGTRSVNNQDLSKNLKFFNVPEASIQSIYSKLTMRVFDVYANILKRMYSTRFNGGSKRSEASPEVQSTPIVVTTLIRTIDTSRPDKRNLVENRLTHPNSESQTEDSGGNDSSDQSGPHYFFSCDY
jgi:hypothetical protein